ncbi:disks large-associated protein 1 isoform X2 [Silurus asotus]|uniref:Disks large-associated protein 1 isoform X2 n=1 Tax=Silurus asotus TaxID=30991 RepID=A0AAD5AIT0_SILAS|nr:disks large-associated protein 1 isoform X2 [Silurus asotus]
MMMMKGLSSSRSHHHMVACEPSYDPMGHHGDRKPYLISQIEAPPPPDHPYYSSRSSYQPDCVVPYGTFPRRHYSTSHEPKEECAVVPYTGGMGPVGKCQRVPVNLLEHLDRQLPMARDGYHTLQYKRAAAAAAALEQRNDSPGRIRHLVHSVQKLFTKSHSLEGPHHGGHGHGHSKSSMNGSKASPDGENTPAPTPRQRKRSKSRERCKSAEPKQRTPPSGYWSSDELERDVCPLRHAAPGIMTVGRHPERAQSQYFLEACGAEPTLKNSRSSSDVAKCTTCAITQPGTDVAQLAKKSAWSSSLTVSRARQVYQQAAVNLDKALVKAEACQQERTCQFLQVPQDEWGGFPIGKEEDIPCRRMRSGSYVKAMAEDDSGDSDGSPKPSPKMQARRASYLKATQPSLTEMTTLNISTEHSPKLQIRSHSYLRAVSEVSINRSMENLDPKALLASPQYRSRNESYMRAMSTISQVSEVEVNGQIEAVCESVFSEMESQAVDALDLPVPGCFRMRSHSYVRAIDQGCSQDDDGPLLPASPPRTTTTVRTIQSSTDVFLPFLLLLQPTVAQFTLVPCWITIPVSVVGNPGLDRSVSSCITTYKKTPPPVPPRSSTKPFISITAQSSTESAQDAYMDGPGHRHGDTALHSALSNSTESIDSMKALTAAIEAANAQVDGPEDQEAEDQSKFHHRRIMRSNSVTAAVQADLDMPDFSPTESPDNDVTFSRDATASTVSIQGSGNHYHACTSDDYASVGFDPSVLPPPEPWVDSGVIEDQLQSARSRSVCQRDGRWFLKLLQAEAERMEGWCRQMEQEERHNELPDDILGKIRSAVGSAQLLMSQKFQQFRELCEENQNLNAHPRPVAQDLAGFWDMLQLSIENISLKFDELHQLKANNWRPLDPPERKERRLPPPVPKKPVKCHPPLARDRSLESSEKQRQEARKRLMAAKRAASVRQNSATESADSIEIYIPEAQTRL